MDSAFIPCYNCDDTLMLVNTIPVYNKYGRLLFYLEIFRCTNCDMEFCFRQFTDYAYDFGDDE